MSEAQKTVEAEEEETLLDLQRVMIMPRVPRVVRMHLRAMCADIERRFNIRTTYAHLIVKMCVEDNLDLLEVLQDDEELRAWFNAQGIA